MTSCSQRYLCLRCVCDPVVDSILPSSPFSVWLLVIARGPSVIGLPTWRTDRDGPGFPSPAPWASQEACSQCLLGMPRPTGGYLTGTRLVSPAPSGAPVTPPPACAPPPSPCAPCSSFYLAISGSPGVPSLPMSPATPQSPYVIQNLGFL